MYCLNHVKLECALTNHCSDEKLYDFQGYTNYAIGCICEWATTTLILIYILTFSPEFRHVHMTTMLSTEQPPAARLPANGTIKNCDALNKLINLLTSCWMYSSMRKAEFIRHFILPYMQRIKSVHFYRQCNYLRFNCSVSYGWCHMTFVVANNTCLLNYKELVTNYTEHLWKREDRQMVGDC